ncbi:unnamed protein product, partial [marine sediment metagenome]
MIKISLTTRIRGLQIKDGDIGVLQLGTDAVETVKIKDKNVTLTKLEDGTEAYIIVVGDDSVPAYKAVSGDITIDKLGAVAIGATKVTDAMMNDDVATGLAGDGLSDTTGVIDLDLNELTAAVVAVANDSIAFIDSDGNVSRKESIADLATAMAGVGITATAGVLAADAVSDNIIEGDIQLEDHTATCDSAETEFTLSNTPLANSLDVYLNGMRQPEGSGEAFTLAGDVITFATAPDTTDDLYIRY